MPMAEKTKNHKKVFFREEDAATLTQRYGAITVLRLLQEVANYRHLKIDWNELVRKTSTGISNAREYQMLWRHLAYRDALPEKFDDGGEPLDDDSDLECELEALPPVTSEPALEAAACVKVMIASHMLSESTPSSSTIEAPLTINVPVLCSSGIPTGSSQTSNLTRGTNIIFPVTVQRQTQQNISSTEALETKGSVGGNIVIKKKRKALSEEENIRATIPGLGEGNLAIMANGDNFPSKRNALELAQGSKEKCKKEKRRQQEGSKEKCKKERRRQEERCSVLQKKDDTTNSGTISANSQYTAELLATRHSLSLALEMTFEKPTAPGMTDPARTSFNTSIKNPVQTSNTAEAMTVHSSFVPPAHPSQQALLKSSRSPAKSEVVPEKPVLKCNPSPDPEVKATTVAAGACIVSPSDTASQLKAAQARNAVHIISNGSSLTKSSIPACSPTEPKAYSNVPYICTGSTATLVPSYSPVAVTSPASCTNALKATSPSVENPPASSSII